MKKRKGTISSNSYTITKAILRGRAIEVKAPVSLSSYNMNKRNQK